jgi:hypothetical protein
VDRRADRARYAEDERDQGHTLVRGAKPDIQADHHCNGTESDDEQKERGEEASGGGVGRLGGDEGR